MRGSRADIITRCHWKDIVMKPAKILRFWMVAVLLCLLSATYVFAQTGNGYTGKVTIVHVNDIHTYVDASDTAIGYAKIAGYYDQLKAENPNTLFLDAGDTFSGTPNALIDYSDSIIPILNTMGFDVMVTGNHDYAFGSKQLLKLAGMLDYPVLSANIVYRETGEPLLDSYTILTLDNGMKVGVIGLTHFTAQVMGAADVKYTDPIPVAQKLVDELKPQVDLVIGLLHVGVGEDAHANSPMIANEVKGMDVIIDGHTHTVLPEGRVENGILIAQAGEYSKYFGVVDLFYENGKLVDSKACLISKEEAADLPEKAQTAAALAQFKQTSADYLAQVVGETTVALGESSRDVIRTQETALGSFYADVMRQAVGADVAMFNTGVIAGNFGPGKITMADLATVTRTDSLIIVKEMTGQDIIDFINYCDVSYPKSSGIFVQVSGISFVLDPALEKDKVFDVKVGGKDIDLKQTYNVAILLGASDYPGAINGKFVKEVDFTLNILKKYMAENPVISPVTDGRISSGTKPAL